MPPAAFERQIASLVRRRLRPVRAQDLLGNPARALHVTFDDAYRNVASALPAMERHGVHATVFACSGFARDGRALDVPELRVRSRSAPGELATMDWDALREIADRGVEIGAHTVTHAHLPALGDAELERDLVDGRTEIEDELGRPCRFLAYPYGEHDARVRAAAAAAGYVAAFGLSDPAGDADRFALPRSGLYRRDDGLRFLLKTSAPRRAVTTAYALRRWRTGRLDASRRLG